jgi:hypothetical protein
MWLPNLVLGTWGLLASARAIELWRPGLRRVLPWDRAGAGAPLAALAESPRNGPSA